MIVNQIFNLTTYPLVPSSTPIEPQLNSIYTDLTHCAQNQDAQEGPSCLDSLIKKICDWMSSIWESIKSLFCYPKPKTIDFQKLFSTAPSKANANVVIMHITPCLDARSLIYFGLSCKKIHVAIPFEDLQKATWAGKNKLNFFDRELPLSAHIDAYYRLSNESNGHWATQLPPNFIDFFGWINLSKIPYFAWNATYKTNLPAPMIRISDGLAVQYKQNSSENPEEFVELYVRYQIYDGTLRAYTWKFQVDIYKNGEHFQQHQKINSLAIANRYHKLLKREPVGPLNLPLHTTTRAGKPILEIIEPRNNNPAS